MNLNLPRRVPPPAADDNDIFCAILFKFEICVNVQAMVPDVRCFRSALPFKDTVCRTFIFDENERVQNSDEYSLPLPKKGRQVLMD